jgi:hypothetical protein
MSWPRPAAQSRISCLVWLVWSRNDGVSSCTTNPQAETGQPMVRPGCGADRLEGIDLEV